MARYPRKVILTFQEEMSLGSTDRMTQLVYDWAVRTFHKSGTLSTLETAIKFKGSREKIERINPMGEGEPIPAPPPYDQVMPRQEDCNVLKDVKLGNLIMDVTANLALVKIGPAWCNAQYAREALAGSGSWDAYYQGSLDPIMFVCSDSRKIAVVMPIRY